MPAKIVQVADAVVALLNGGSFSMMLAAKRMYLPRFELAEMASLHVTVVPVSGDVERISRSKKVYSYVIDIAVQKRAVEQDDLDSLAALTEELADYILDNSLTYSNLHCIGISVDPIYAPEHLEELGQFTSVISATYREWE